MKNKTCASHWAAREIVYLSIALDKNNNDEKEDLD